MAHYKYFGFTNLELMLEKAYKEKYAVGAFNFISVEQLNGIADALIEKKSPAILLASPNLCQQYEFEMIVRMAQAAVDRISHHGIAPQVALHLDHGMTFKHCETAIANGFSSVMIDGSSLPFYENIRITKQVVDFAHQYGVSVEGELGVVSGAEEIGMDAVAENYYTDADQVKEFVEETGVDCLAISIGTCHGLVKMKPLANGSLPELKFSILDKISELLPGFPIVLHGASNIPTAYVDMINQYGGSISQTIGIPDAQIKKAVEKAVCKVNIASDGWITGLALTRKILSENPAAIDSRVFKNKIRPFMKDLYLDKIELFGSAGKL